MWIPEGEEIARAKALRWERVKPVRGSARRSVWVEQSDELREGMNRLGPPRPS